MAGFSQKDTLLFVELGTRLVHPVNKKAISPDSVKSRRKNVNIVNTQIVNNADYNPSDHPDVNMDHVNR